ncbi:MULTISPECIES: hypothetical protein [unclassified Rhizobium]|uniref:hypothetical protein n=1 Tax=unclassified Rhizobium TaxID=2613769 RepID=UPI00177A8B15|nr:MULTISPECIES: hypothetical protein [unclassified Rhizobium]MBD8688793.1 hypothetical protein [Rhizobium sp. CFBP 13644]MBD8694365.1 hypothetical protein [Rhizobium sp. CFBP 13717]
MIPVALPPAEVLLLFAFCLAATLFWSVWTLRLMVRFATGRWCRPAILPYALNTAFALLTLWQFVDFYLQMRTYERERAAIYRPELSEAVRLGQIDMPVGTKLELAVADQRDSFNRAVFPTPVRVADIDAVEVARYVSIKTSENYEIVGFNSENMRITGHGMTMQAGWRCDATQPVEFDLKPDGGIAAFSKCTLDDGNVVDGITLPKGTSLRASTGNVYTDGFVDSDRWVLDPPVGLTVRIDGLDLEDANLSLDRERKLYEVRNAVLSKMATRGEHPYVATSHISYNPRHFRESYSNVWLITPPQDRKGSQLVSPDTIVQDRAGRVLAKITD